jgi:hypothetical protein
MYTSILDSEESREKQLVVVSEEGIYNVCECTEYMFSVPGLSGYRCSECIEGVSTAPQSQKHKRQQRHYCKKAAIM